MQITLVHNPTAGDEDHSRIELTSIITAAGHQLTYRSAKKRFASALREAELVVVAGGDGTVAKVARALLDTGIPLTILPLGTANNIAKSFGIGGSVESLVRGWTGGKLARYVQPSLCAPWGKARCFESAGFGAFARLLAVDPPNPEEGMKVFRRIAARGGAEDWEVIADGKDISGKYVLFEAMNIRTIGPNLDFAPLADPSDDVLDLVTITDDQRDLLLQHLDAGLQGSTVELPIRRVRSMRLRCEGEPFHVDDVLWPKNTRAGWVDVDFAGDAVKILVPR